MSYNETPTKGYIVKDKLKKIRAAIADNHEVILATTVGITIATVLYYHHKQEELKHRIPFHLPLDEVKALQDGRTTKATITTDEYIVEINQL